MSPFPKSHIGSFLALTLVLLSLTFGGCKSERTDLSHPLEEWKVKGAKKLLNGQIVFGSHAYMGTVNLTRLPKGAPIKYRFTWKDGDVLNFRIERFHVGEMPLELWFDIDVKLQRLNGWEEKEYSGEGWIKFAGSGGVSSFTGLSSEYPEDLGEGKKGDLTGYLNVKTGEIECKTNFNVLNVSSEVYLQKIDPTRITHYEEELAQYNRDLKEWKKTHS